MGIKKTTSKKKSKKSTANEKLKSLENENTDLKNKNIRLLAEFDNFKKRSYEEKKKIIKYDGLELVTNILPIIDDIDRTLKLKDMKKNKSIFDGIKMIHDKLVKNLNQIGVESYDSKNKDFNPDLHEALMTKKSKKKSNIVLEEYEKGYKYNDRVIRHAKVIVSK